MTVQSNPRKLYQSGNGTVVGLPEDILQEAGLTKGDRVRLTADEGEIVVEPVEWRVKDDE
jgi:antitoxin component of MazEF toxin-antitoxin module